MKQFKKLLIRLLSIWLLYQAICLGYWYARAWGGDSQSEKMKNLIRKLPSEAVIKKLYSTQLSNPYPSIALRVLAERKEKKAVPVLLKWLKSWDTSKRRDAIWALGIIGDERAIEPLMDIIRKGEKHPNYNIVLLALSEMKYDGIFPYLEKIAKEPYPKCTAVITDLKEFGKPECIPLLLEIKSKINNNAPLAKFDKSRIDDAIKHIEYLQK